MGPKFRGKSFAIVTLDFLHSFSPTFHRYAATSLFKVRLVESICSSKNGSQTTGLDEADDAEQEW
jgi:hypothetical protein